MAQASVLIVDDSDAYGITLASILGRTVAVAGIPDFEVQLRAMMDKLGLDIGQVEIVPHS